MVQNQYESRKEDVDEILDYSDEWQEIHFNIGD